MSKKDKDQVKDQEQDVKEEEKPVPEEKTTTPELTAGPSEVEKLQAVLKEQEDKYLRLAAEYDNYRKRTQKEKDAVWTDATSAAVTAFLPIYDNLALAMKQPTSDEAYAKGVEMTMNQLKAILEKLGVEEIQALGQTFDPALHNAVVHVKDEELGENTVVEVFQSGFKKDEKVIRFAMVKVAN